MSTEKLTMCVCVCVCVVCGLVWLCRCESMLWLHVFFFPVFYSLAMRVAPFRPLPSLWNVYGNETGEGLEAQWEWCGNIVGICTSYWAVVSFCVATLAGSIEIWQTDYSIDLMQLISLPHVTKCCGWKSGYYAAILNGKNDHGLCTRKQSVSSSVTSTRNGFTFLPRMHKVSTRSDVHWSE